MMRIGIFSDEISQDFEHALGVIKELGVEYVELRSMWGKNLMSRSPNELKRVKELIKGECFPPNVVRTKDSGTWETIL